MLPIDHRRWCVEVIGDSFLIEKTKLNSTDSEPSGRSTEDICYIPAFLQRIL